jgi:sporulation protein YlmC with PRC-barrel domain
VIRLSQLLRSAVVTEDGRELGHVFDVRVARRPGSSAERADQQWRIVGLLVGERGLRERLGMKKGRAATPRLEHDLVPWDSVLRLEAGTVTVAEGTEPE